jgi:dihydromethanopterin reductase (acceptor)
MLIVSPTTSNTIGKIVNGIADTLITNAVAQSGKGLVETYIIPVDLESGVLQTVLPSKLELDLCQNCETCAASAACPNDAITPGVEINLLKCKGCGACQIACEFGAVTGGRLINIHMRDIDIQNTNKLFKIDEIEVLRHPNDLKNFLF